MQLPRELADPQAAGFAASRLEATRTPSIYGWWGTQNAFGHAGAFSALAYADPSLDLAAGIVTNGNRGPYESLFRFASLGTALRRACR
jgi:CubicO group peptidase (beta-lactamase class C family)